MRVATVGDIHCKKESQGVLAPGSPPFRLINENSRPLQMRGVQSVVNNLNIQSSG